MKKVHVFILSAVAVLVGLGGIFYLSHQNLTSHTASIDIDMSIYEKSEERVAKFEAIVSTMKAWAAESEMYLVDRKKEAVNLSSFTTNPNADVRETYFKDRLASGGPMPLQGMVSYDVNGSLQIVRIRFTEGYSKKPSERLEKTSRDLYARMKDFKTIYSIW
jgi:hypothetical protein